jgi:hypothetical protein
LERELLHLHPRIIYKLGQVYLSTDGCLLAEIAIEGKREFLVHQMAGHRWNQPVALESIGWGWLSEDDSEAGLMPSTSPFDSNPLAQVVPLDGVVESILSKNRLWLRYLVLVATSLLLVIMLIANVIYKYSLVLELVYVVIFLAWMLALNETPLDLRVYAQKVICSSDGIEVKYWFKAQPILVLWHDIWGLDFSEPVCILFTLAKRSRFILSERFGCQQQKVILKTIVERSDLNYVEGNFIRLIYRRYEADETK